MRHNSLSLIRVFGGKQSMLTKTKLISYTHYLSSMSGSVIFGQISIPDVFKKIALLNFAPLYAPVGIYPAFLLQNFNCGKLLFPAQRAAFNYFFQRDDPKFIKPGLRGKLIGMSAPFYDKRFIDEPDGKANRYPKPKIIILARKKALIKQTCFAKKLFSHHHGGRADQAQRKRGFKNHSGHLFMPQFGIHPSAVPNPGFFRLAN